MKYNLNFKFMHVLVAVLIFVLPGHGKSSEIDDPQLIGSIWTTGSGKGPKARTIAGEIEKVQGAFRKKFDGRKKYENQSKGVVAEAAAVAFFQVNGWVPWEAGDCALGKCFADRVPLYGGAENPNDFMTTEQDRRRVKGRDNGIDGLFTAVFGGTHYLVINESKYRTGKTSLSKDDFGVLADGTRQSSSTWNGNHLVRLGFQGVGPWFATYGRAQYTLIRTATFLNEKGDFKLYNIKGKNPKSSAKVRFRDPPWQIPTSPDFTAVVAAAIKQIRSTQ